LHAGCDLSHCVDPPAAKPSVPPYFFEALSPKKLDRSGHAVGSLVEVGRSVPDLGENSPAGYPEFRVNVEFSENTLVIAGR